MKRIKIFILISLMILPFFLSAEKSGIKEKNLTAGKEGIRERIGNLIEGEIIKQRLSYDSPILKSHSIFPSVEEFEEDGIKKLICVWSEETGLKNIYYTKKENNPNKSWSTPAKASFTAVNSKTPNLCVDPRKPHIVHMVWADGETRNTKDIFHTRYFDKGWHGMTRLVSHPNNDSFPVPAVLVDGTINCVWEFMMPNPQTKQYDNTHLRSGNTWTTNEEQTIWDPKGRGVSTNKDHHATHIDVACRGFRSYAAWQEGTSGQRVIMFSEKIQKEGEDDHWSWPTQISTNKHSFWPKIIVDSLYNVHIMWGEMQGRYGFNCRVFGEWEEPSIINKGAGKREFFWIDVDDKDTLHVVFRGDSFSPYYSAKSAYNQGPWPTEERITTEVNSVGHCHINAHDSTEYVHVAFSDLPRGGVFEREIVYATFKKWEDTFTGYPEADFTMSVEGTIVEGTAVTFDASPSKSTGGSIHSYHWNFGDPFAEGNLSEKKVETFVFEKEGEYTVTLAVYDKGRKLIDTKSATIDVIAGPMSPLNAVTSTLLNSGFLYRDWLNKIEWEANPKNTELGFTIENYKIYRRVKGTGNEWAHLADVSGSTYYYYDKGFTSRQDAMEYEYGVSVLADGIESSIVPATAR
ncbi:MAG: PKD domain-containing protein [Candidatus Aminicenantes bacterium]|nr:PKD domain-containing protein [Candidatus Aminicenantes bacterium]